MDVYMQAARAMQCSLDGKGKLKDLVLQNDVQKKRATYAVAAEASKHMQLLDDILKGAGFFEANKTFWPCLARVMCYDALFGGGLRGETRTGPGYAVKKHAPKLKAAMAELLRKLKLPDVAALLQRSAPPRIPIYLRVNTLAATVDEVIKAFVADGWRPLDTPDVQALLTAARPHKPGRGGGAKRAAAEAEEAEKEEPAKKKSKKKPSKGEELKKKASSGGKGGGGGDDADDDEAARKVFFRDPMLTSLLVFPPSAKFYLVKHEVCRQHKAVIQDKASCLPPYVLLHCLPMRSLLDREGGEEAAGTTAMGPVMDCTAAPGNKTSLLAMISKGRRPVYAVERDDQRAGVLTDRLQQLRCEKVSVVNKSFLELEPSDYPHVEGMLLDPSCSGTGIVDRIDPGSKRSEEETRQRLQGLAEFQTSMILHAMKFPAVRRIVYSTCSVNKEENEEVVQRVLQNDEVEGAWGLADIMPSTWTSRALPLFQDSQNCIRCVPKDDGTNGFFVACFEKIPTGKKKKKAGKRARGGQRAKRKRENAAARAAEEGSDGGGGDGSDAEVEVTVEDPMAGGAGGDGAAEEDEVEKAEAPPRKRARVVKKKKAKSAA